MVFLRLPGVLQGESQPHAIFRSGHETDRGRANVSMTEMLQDRADATATSNELTTDESREYGAPVWNVHCQPNSRPNVPTPVPAWPPRVLSVFAALAASSA